MEVARQEQSVQDTVLDAPVATILHLVAVLAVAIVFVANGGHLTDDAERFFVIVIGGNGLVSLGRGLAARKAG